MLIVLLWIVRLRWLRIVRLLIVLLLWHRCCWLLVRVAIVRSVRVVLTTRGVGRSIVGCIVAVAIATPGCCSCCCGGGQGRRVVRLFLLELLLLFLLLLVF